MINLLENKAPLEKLREDNSLIDNTVEEILPYYTGKLSIDN
jgi:hypothetical protein